MRQRCIISGLIPGTVYPSNRALLTRKLAIFAAILIGLCLSGHAERLRIVVAGDGRSEYPWGDERPEDADGLNQTINREICNAVKQEKANIFLWTGDIVNVTDRAGDKPEDKTYFLRNGLNKWHEIMGELYDSGVKVLPVRGNHEVEWKTEKDKTGYEIANAAATWKDVFRDLPDNGPKGEEKLSFWYATDSVLCIGLDQYENRRHLINQTWLEDVLNRNRQELKKPFIFAFGHEPAFATGSTHVGDEILAAHPHIRDHMWKTLREAGAHVYFCGHDHFYDHMKVDGGPTNLAGEMHQVSAGIAGAPFYSHADYPQDEDWVLTRVKHTDFVYGYVLVTIEGNAAKIEFKARNLDGQYKTRESFNFIANRR